MSKFFAKFNPKKGNKISRIYTRKTKKIRKFLKFFFEKIAKFRHKKYTGHYYYTSFFSLRQTVAGSLRFAVCE
jgi:uncharacterized protein (DUF608 family)